MLIDESVFFFVTQKASAPKPSRCQRGRLYPVEARGAAKWRLRAATLRERLLEVSLAAPQQRAGGREGAEDAEARWKRDLKARVWGYNFEEHAKVRS